MPQLTNAGVIRDILKRHGFTFSKGLGQNFLINPSVAPRMAEAAGAGPGTGILEIGPGIGVLTAQLAARAEKVVAVELDGRLPPILAETLAEFNNVKIVQGDALKLDLAGLIAAEFPGLRVGVAANLPYYITSPLIMRLLESRLPIEAITVMVQREAAQRLCAAPGQRAAGAVSLGVRYFSEPRVLFQVSRGSFLPAPRVDSSVIQLKVLPAPPVDVIEEGVFFAVVKAAFSQRRKTLPNALSSGLNLPKEALAALLEGCGTSREARAESLTLGQFAALANAVARLP